MYIIIQLFCMIFYCIQINIKHDEIRIISLYIYHIYHLMKWKIYSEVEVFGEKSPNKSSHRGNLLACGKVANVSAHPGIHVFTAITDSFPLQCWDRL